MAPLYKLKMLMINIDSRMCAKLELVDKHQNQIFGLVQQVTLTGHGSNAVLSENKL